MTNQWMDFLTSQRLQPSAIRDNGDILFTHDGMTVLLGHNPFRMCVPDIWPIENERERLAVLHVINSINASVKFVKLFTQQKENLVEYIEAEIESAIDHSFDDLPDIFPNYLAALSFAVHDFERRMNGVRLNTRD